MIKIMKIVFLSLMCVGCTNNQDVNIELQPNFRGIVIIIFDQQGSQKITTPQQERLYIIPNSGVLYTKFSIQYGRFKTKVYYKDSEIEIPQPFNILELQNSSSDDVLAYSFEQRSRSKDFPSYLTFLVGKKSEMDSLASIRDKMVHLALTKRR